MDMFFITSNKILPANNHMCKPCTNWYPSPYEPAPTDAHMVKMFLSQYVIFAVNHPLTQAIQQTTYGIALRVWWEGERNKSNY